MGPAKVVLEPKSVLRVCDGCVTGAQKHPSKSRGGLGVLPLFGPL